MVTDEQIKFIVDTADDLGSEHTWGEIRTMIKEIWREDVEEEMLERIYMKYRKGAK